MPSQWALQYFSFPPGTQLQAGFAHFFGVLAMFISSGAADPASQAFRA